MAHNQIVRGYIGFNFDMTCRGYQYEVGKTYRMNGMIRPCERGFHFCKNIADVFRYYSGKECRYAEASRRFRCFAMMDKVCI